MVGITLYFPTYLKTLDQKISYNMNHIAFSGTLYEFLSNILKKPMKKNMCWPIIIISQKFDQFYQRHMWFELRCIS